MQTVTQLAKNYHVSRTTILYYERAGLLLPACRSENGYRWYGDLAQEQILRDQFNSLEQEIQKLRQQQKAIVMLLEQPTLLEQNMVTKQRWVEIMKAAGLNEQDMKNWHKQFEKMEPDAHQEFLESLSIDAEEIKKISGWSKA